MKDLKELINNIRCCNHCEADLPHGVNPIFSFSAKSKVVLVSQAPGIHAHTKGIPYQDQSGVRLRKWLGVSDEIFYTPDNFAILPMGFCYPGKGKSGDLPPKKECAELWHEAIWQQLHEVQLIVLIGQYAQKAYLEKRRKKSLTKTVLSYKEYLPQYFPIVHPSPRNQIWLKKNSWFEEEVIPVLQHKIKLALE